MFLKSQEILPESTVTDIVNRDYRTASVFKKYDIAYCCGGRWPLKTICETRNLDLHTLIQELENAGRNVRVPGSLDFHEWGIDFLVDYLINVHHHYLGDQLPVIQSMVNEFADEHTGKYSYLPGLQSRFDQLVNDLVPHLKQEEEVIFPYIRQIEHAYKSMEPYAGLLVKTLRKPVEEMMKHEHVMVSDHLQFFRDATANYAIPAQACPSHRVLFRKLEELDNDLNQHLYLENEILFPRAIGLEKKLLERFR
jgi:regulator of cell morphogenesis and NO signaling